MLNMTEMIAIQGTILIDISFTFGNRKKKF